MNETAQRDRDRKNCKDCKERERERDRETDREVNAMSGNGRRQQ